MSLWLLIQCALQADGAKGRAELSMNACVGGLNRAEAARVFYQLLGAPPATFVMRVNHHSRTPPFAWLRCIVTENHTAGCMCLCPIHDYLCSGESSCSLSRTVTRA